jgi:hypothetical protein
MIYTMYFNTVPHEQVVSYWNTQHWQGNCSNPSFKFNLTNNSSLGWSSYQNTGVWSPSFSPSYGHTSKLDETLASSCKHRRVTKINML